MTTKDAKTEYPNGWGTLAAEYDPNKNLMQLKGRDYLNVQNRLLWFIRDQRAIIAAGLATHAHVIQTELVELDRAQGFAHFKTYVRDALGNEATMYGSESAKDFGDYAEKASTKSLGRALLALGYGTAFAPEMDEGERVVDAPRERQSTSSAPSAPAAPRPFSPVLSRTMEHLPAGTTATDIKQFADANGVTGPQWGALWKESGGGGDLGRLWTMLRIHLRSLAAASPSVSRSSAK